ncbi:MAG: rRNA pseudouridine synthase [Candidatus Marinimicrobia bacterium]|nr:rRNA pseudouridine synthase [Candidatus Neomarinimicrobiota bacterium]
MTEIRLNRYLSLCGVASRRKCEQLILDERVSVNGKIVTDLFVTVGDKDVVRLDDEKVSPQKYTYIVMNKPKDLMTTLNDEKNRDHVGMLIRRNIFVKPVGRLDRNTTGVLLLTNDGELQYRLTHPKYKIVRLYQVVLDKHLTIHVMQKINTGVQLSKKEIARAKVVEFKNVKTQALVLLELQEGMNREIRRLFQVLGYKVIKLDRLKYAEITATGLKRGQWRHLSGEEVQLLKQQCGLNY